MARFHLLLLESMPNTPAVDALAQALPPCVDREAFARVRSTAITVAVPLATSDDEATIGLALTRFQSAGCFVCIIDQSGFWDRLRDRLRGLRADLTASQGERPGPSGRTGTQAAPSSAPRPEVHVRRADDDPRRRNAILFGAGLVVALTVLGTALFGGEVAVRVAQRAESVASGAEGLESASEDDPRGGERTAPPQTLNVATRAGAGGAEAAAPAGGPQQEARATREPSTLSQGLPVSATAPSEVQGRDGERPGWMRALAGLLSFGLGVGLSYGLRRGISRTMPAPSARVARVARGVRYGLVAATLGLVGHGVLRGRSEPAPAPVQAAPEAAPSSSAPPPAAPRPPFARLLIRSRGGAQPPVDPGPSPFSRWMAQYRARHGAESAAAPTVAVETSAEPAPTGRRRRRSRASRLDPHRVTSSRTAASTTTPAAAPQPREVGLAGVPTVGAHDAGAAVMRTELPAAGSGGADLAAAEGPRSTQVPGDAGPAEEPEAHGPSRRSQDRNPEGPRSRGRNVQALLLGAALGLLVSQGRGASGERS